MELNAPPGLDRPGGPGWSLTWAGLDRPGGPARGLTWADIVAGL